jgi:hypothetical protein
VRADQQNSFQSLDKTLTEYVVKRMVDELRRDVKSRGSHSVVSAQPQLRTGGGKANAGVAGRIPDPRRQQRPRGCALKASRAEM